VVNWKVQKEAVVACVKVLSDIRLEGLRKTKKHFG
jgi:hypothetical protein